MILVSGQPRSGTSLMMKILEESGIPVVCDEKLSYEDSRTGDLRGKGEWLLDVPPDSAIKILWPQLGFVPRGPVYRVIWMRRNPKEQARSQAKFLGKNKLWRKEKEKLIRGVEKKVPQLIGGEMDLVIIQFEDVIAGNNLSSLSKFLGRTINTSSVFSRKLGGRHYPVGYFESKGTLGGTQ